jgi:hypothetical protein
MKTTTRRIIAMLVVGCALAGMFCPAELRAAALNMGTFTWGRAGGATLLTGAKQTGRFRNFGTGYYDTGYVSVSTIVNRSAVRTGSLSLELWATPYYGAAYGFVNFSRALNPLSARHYYPTVFRSGLFRIYGANITAYYPRLNLYELSNGWKLRAFLLSPSQGLL